MIVDCFPFFNELDLLEIRLNELSSIVDLFVLTEGTLTFRANKKQLYFADNKSLFSKFNIKHIVIDDYSRVNIADPWALEEHQRQTGIYHVIDMKLSQSDMVLVSDCDEISRAEAVNNVYEIDTWNCVN